MPSTVASETLGPLRQRFASIERSSGFPFGAEEAGLPLGLPALDGALGGGLAFGALHEIAPAAPIHLGAAFGFALAMTTRAMCHAGHSGAAHALSHRDRLHGAGRR